jgi:hypothetical protein
MLKNLRVRVMIFSVSLAALAGVASHFLPVLKSRGFHDGDI